MSGAYSTHETDKCIRSLARKPERKRPLGRPRRKCKDNIRMDRRKIRLEDVDWIHLDQDRDQ